MYDIIIPKLFSFNEIDNKRHSKHFLCFSRLFLIFFFNLQILSTKSLPPDKPPCKIAQFKTIDFDYKKKMFKVHHESFYRLANELIMRN